MPSLKKCYYEVLGVERNAGDDEIKKAFRRLALQLHPDKNPERAEEAKKEFQILQQAYEVLSNPQERAWYDKHRQAVLREGLDPSDYDDFNIDILAYCTSSCYKGFGDDEEGFYAVYRELFAKLSAEELEAGWEEEHDEEIPNFGDSESGYEDVVGPFYAFWEAFCTVKSFAWNDEYDTRRAECRRIARLMDKENRKIRTEARKAWNREVRALVDFVKRKDKRVVTWRVLQEERRKEKEAELVRKEQEAKKKRLEERKKLLETVKEKKDAKVAPEALKEMEQLLKKEFGEQLDSEEEELTCFHCAACNKSFRTEKAYINHEKSKKHLQQVERLRELMEEEDEMFDENDEVEEEEDEEAELQSEHEEVDGDEEDETNVNGVTDAEVNGTAEKMEELTVQDSEQEQDEFLEEESGHDSDHDLLKKPFFAKGRKSNIQVFHESEPEDEENLAQEKFIITNPSKDEEDERKVKKGAKKAKRKKEKGTTTTPKVEISSSSAPAPEPPAPQTKPVCAVCKEAFKSRTLLFKHIKSSGHAAPLDTIKKQVKMEDEEPLSKPGKKRKSKKT